VFQGPVGLRFIPFTVYNLFVDLFECKFMQSPNLRTPNPGFNPGFTPPFYITNAGVNPGLNPGFDVLRCGPRFGSPMSSGYVITDIIVNIRLKTMSDRIRSLHFLNFLKIFYGSLVRSLTCDLCPPGTHSAQIFHAESRPPENSVSQTILFRYKEIEGLLCRKNSIVSI
jgi:hypothetical protein